jgi:hypothetical protein
MSSRDRLDPASPSHPETIKTLLSQVLSPIATVAQVSFNHQCLQIMLAASPATDADTVTTRIYVIEADESFEDNTAVLT